MNIYVQKGDQIGISFGSDGDYCCDHYDRSDHSFHFEWQKIWKPDRRWNFKAITADFRTSETFAEGDLDSEFPEHDAKDEVAEMIETARKDGR